MRTLPVLQDVLSQVQNLRLLMLRSSLKVHVRLSSEAQWRCSRVPNRCSDLGSVPGNRGRHHASQKNCITSSVVFYNGAHLCDLNAHESQ